MVYVRAIDSVRVCVRARGRAMNVLGEREGNDRIHNSGTGFARRRVRQGNAGA
jgi:hypothetical protein